MTIFYEYVHNYPHHPPESERHTSTASTSGTATRLAGGRANTLVVDVANFNGQAWLDSAGNFHSEALHVVERYTRTDAGTMMYEATIEDPKVFTRPWKISMPLHLHREPNFRLLEYECHAYAEDAAKEQAR